MRHDKRVVITASYLLRAVSEVRDDREVDQIKLKLVDLTEA